MFHVSETWRPLGVPSRIYQNNILTEKKEEIWSKLLRTVIREESLGKKQRMA